MAEQLLKVHDVCERAQLGRSKVYELIATGDLPSIAIGRSRRVRESDFENWLRVQQGPASLAPRRLPTVIGR